MRPRAPERSSSRRAIPAILLGLALAGVDAGAAGAVELPVSAFSEATGIPEVLQDGSGIGWLLPQRLESSASRFFFHGSSYQSSPRGFGTSLVAWGQTLSYRAIPSGETPSWGYADRPFTSIGWAGRRGAWRWGANWDWASEAQRTRYEERRASSGTFPPTYSRLGFQSEDVRVASGGVGIEVGSLQIDAAVSFRERHWKYQQTTEYRRNNGFLSDRDSHRSSANGGFLPGGTIRVAWEGSDGRLATVVGHWQRVRSQVEIRVRYENFSADTSTPLETYSYGFDPEGYRTEIAALVGRELGDGRSAWFHARWQERHGEWDHEIERSRWSGVRSDLQDVSVGAASRFARLGNLSLLSGVVVTRSRERGSRVRGQYSFNPVYEEVEETREIDGDVTVSHELRWGLQYARAPLRATVALTKNLGPLSNWFAAFGFEIAL